MERQEWYEESLYETLLSIPDLDALSYDFEEQLFARVDTLIEGLFGAGDSALSLEFHETLALLLGTARARPHTWEAQQNVSRVAFFLRKLMWEGYLWHELRRLSDVDLPPVPEDPWSLIEYLVEVNAEHHASNHPLFDYLKEMGSGAEIEAYLLQEGSALQGLDDVIALGFVGNDHGVKVEFARYFQDHTGFGDVLKARDRLFVDAYKYVKDTHGAGWPFAVRPSAEALAIANLGLGLALDRRHGWRLAGYLASYHFNLPNHDRKVLEACQRCGMDLRRLGFLTERAERALSYAEGVFEEVIAPFSVSDERAPLEIAQGFLLYLGAAQKYYDALLRLFVQKKPGRRPVQRNM